MKLKNKKTGEIGLLSATDNAPTMFVDSREYKTYNSLAELCEEWEDYEEPKGYWYINSLGHFCWSTYIDEEANIRKKIGNHFETKKEAEIAVEKLKAWKRLGVTSDNCSYRYVGTNESRSGIDSFAYKISIDFETVPDKKDLDLLFGDEE